MNDSKYAKLLSWAFIAGAIVDGLAVIPFVYAPLGASSLGLEKLDPIAAYAMNLKASSLFCWTMLLLWARRSPVERAFVAPFTVLAILGLVIAETTAVTRGLFPASQMISTWCIQAALLALYVPVSIEYFKRNTIHPKHHK